MGSIRRMFTGIIQDVGVIQSIQRELEQAYMTIETTLDMSNWQNGDSIAVDGCCLTLTDFGTEKFSVTLSQETLNLTTFGQAQEGKRANLEPALRMGDALGGHMVSGHVDGTGKVDDIQPAGEHRLFRFSVPENLARYVVKKGSVAVNGVSLTVNEVDGCAFEVNLIPHTLANTNLGDLADGDRVNIETDMYGRYIERMMQFGHE
ncbi:MAG: riboflavin synthase [Zetaproteobacteria bacterium]|nr:MAG: riboflavin synthase [Zetaproteobacteria bacterium]